MGSGLRIGFALKRSYDRLLGHGRELNFGQVYAALTRLERDGFGDGVGVVAGSGADRKLYAITEAGVGELEAWLAEPHLPGGRPGELFTKVVLALVSGRPGAPMLDSQRGVPRTHA